MNTCKSNEMKELKQIKFNKYMSGKVCRVVRMNVCVLELPRPRFLDLFKAKHRQSLPVAMDTQQNGFEKI